MNKSILLLLFSLLALVACRSGKTIVTEKNKTKDSFAIDVTKPLDSIQLHEILRKKSEAFLADTAAFFREQREKNLKSKQESKAIIHDLKTKGFAYGGDVNYGGTKYVILDDTIPQIIKQNFPDIFFFTGRGILGQGDGTEYCAGNDEGYGNLYACFNTVYMNDSLKAIIPLETQLECILTVSKYPFQHCSIIDFKKEDYPSVYRFFPYTHKARVLLENQEVFLRIICRDNAIWRISLYYNNGEQLTISLAIKE